MARKKFYITTSIIYTNTLPHIGFALESIQADVLEDVALPVLFRIHVEEEKLGREPGIHQINLANEQLNRIKDERGSEIDVRVQDDLRDGGNDIDFGIVRGVQAHL